MTRRRRDRALWLILALAVAMVVSIALVVEGSRRSDDPTGGGSCVARGKVGIAGGAELVGLPTAELDRELDEMRQMGATWLRVGADWSLIEPTRGTFDWSSTDRIVEAARRHGFRILGLVLSTPEWARDRGALHSQHALPADTDEFGAFAGRAAERYRATIVDWEVWNEANIRTFAEPRPDVARYSRMLQAASREIRRSAGRPVNIVTSGLAPAGDSDGDYSPGTFIRRLYELGGQEAWDSIGSHPYSYPALPQDTSTASWNQFQKLGELRATLDDFGDGQKQIWMTEVGAPTRGDGAVSDDEQAATLVQLLEAAGDDRRLGPVFIHSTRDRSPDSDDREANFGVLTNDFGRKPAFAAVRSMAVCDAAH